MGLRDWRTRHKFTDPVPGSLEVRRSDWNRAAGAHVDVTLSGMLSAPGIAPTFVTHTGKAPRKKVPVIGAILPVVVDQADPRRFQIDWDQVPTDLEVMEQDFATMAEQATTTPLGGGFPGRTTNVTVTNGDLSSLPPQARQQVEAILGNLGHAFDNLPGTHVTVNGQPVSAAEGGSLMAQFQQFAANMAGHAPGGAAQPTTAVVLSAHNAHHIPEFAASQAPGGIVDLTLDVRGLDGNDYSTTTRVAFSTPERRARLTEPGTEVPVLVNPANPGHVTIDPTRIPGW